MSSNNLKNVQRTVRNDAILEFEDFLSGIGDDEYSIFKTGLNATMKGLKGADSPIKISSEMERTVNTALLGTDGAGFFMKDLCSGAALGLHGFKSKVFGSLVLPKLYTLY